MNWLRFIWRGTSNLVRRDAASIELNVLTYVNGTAACVFTHVMFVSPARRPRTTACNVAADAQKHECNTHVHGKTHRMVGMDCAFLSISVHLCSNARNCFRSFVGACYKSIIAHQQRQQQHNVSFACRTTAALSHSCSLGRFPCHYELVWFVFGSLIYRRRCRLFVFVVLSLAFSWEHTFSANSCSKIELFCWESRTKKFFYVRSFVYVATFF